MELRKPTDDRGATYEIRLAGAPPDSLRRRFPSMRVQRDAGPDRAVPALRRTPATSTRSSTSCGRWGCPSPRSTRPRRSPSGTQRPRSSRTGHRRRAATRCASRASSATSCCATCAGPAAWSRSRSRPGWRPRPRSCSASCRPAPTTGSGSSASTGCTRARRPARGPGQRSAETELATATYCVDPAVDPELAEDPLQVGLHGVRRHVELPRRSRRWSTSGRAARGPGSPARSGSRRGPRSAASRPVRAAAAGPARAGASRPAPGAGVPARRRARRTAATSRPPAGRAGSSPRPRRPGAPGRPGTGPGPGPARPRAILASSSQERTCWSSGARSVCGAMPARVARAPRTSPISSSADATTTPASAAAEAGSGVRTASARRSQPAATQASAETTATRSANQPGPGSPGSSASNGASSRTAASGCPSSTSSRARATTWAVTIHGSWVPGPTPATASRLWRAASASPRARWTQASARCAGTTPAGAESSGLLQHELGVASGPAEVAPDRLDQGELTQAVRPGSASGTRVRGGVGAAGQHPCGLVETTAAHQQRADVGVQHHHQAGKVVQLRDRKHPQQQPGARGRAPRRTRSRLAVGPRPAGRTPR